MLIFLLDDTDDLNRNEDFKFIKKKKNKTNKKILEQKKKFFFDVHLIGKKSQMVIDLIGGFSFYMFSNLVFLVGS